MSQTICQDCKRQKCLQSLDGHDHLPINAIQFCHGTVCDKPKHFSINPTNIFIIPDGPNAGADTRMINRFMGSDKAFNVWNNGLREILNGEIPEKMGFSIINRLGDRIDSLYIRTVEAHIKNRYTVREVLDSLYFDNTDHDGDDDGFIHIISPINGSSVKIERNKIIKII